MKSLAKIFKTQKVLLLGDFMLDVYTFGKAQRLSPEAPVPLLTVEKETYLPGGAGNAVLNLLSLGMEVIALGRVGNDPSGQRFLEMVAEPRVDINGIFLEKGFQTPIKKRMIADHQQLLRVDYEQVKELDRETEKKAKSFLSQIIESVSVVAISDYGKGFLTDSLLKHTLALAKKKAIPVIVDPKGSNFAKYKGATLIKPNLNEAYAASALCVNTPIKEVARKLLKFSDIIMITRAKDGLSLFWKTGEEAHFPADIRQVKDVTGAGDTVLAVMTTLLGNKANLKQNAYLANIAAGIAVERLGCARISKEEILARLN